MRHRFRLLGGRVSHFAACPTPSTAVTHVPDSQKCVQWRTQPQFLPHPEQRHDFPCVGSGSMTEELEPHRIQRSGLPMMGIAAPHSRQ